MERVLANVAIKEEEAQQRVDDLHAKYPDAKFEYRKKDTRYSIVLLDTGATVEVPLIQRMTRTALGGDPAVEEVDVQDPQVTEGVTVGRTNDGGPTGGSRI